MLPANRSAPEDGKRDERGRGELSDRDAWFPVSPRAVELDSYCRDAKESDVRQNLLVLFARRNRQFVSRRAPRTPLVVQRVPSEAGARRNTSLRRQGRGFYGAST